MLDATAIIVNYRSEDHVVELLARLFQQPEECPAQIVIVDNSPDQGLVSRSALQRPEVAYTPLDGNHGFAAAVNAGLRGASGRFVVLLNPDARPEPGCLGGLLDELDSTPGAAIAGPRLTPFHDGDPEVPSATVTEAGLKSILLENTGFRRLVPGSGDWLRRRYFAGPGASPIDAAMVQGACFAVARDWFERAGGLDERFFLYWEETDFCRRVREQGGRVRYCPQLRCRHAGGASTGNEAEASRHYWRGFYGYLHKHHGAFYSLGVRLLMLIGVGAEYLVLRVLGVLRGGRDRKLAEDTHSVRLRMRGQFTRAAR